jgi:hypothetical protein
VDIVNVVGALVFADADADRKQEESRSTTVCDLSGTAIALLFSMPDSRAPQPRARLEPMLSCPRLLRHLSHLYLLTQQKIDPH